MRKRSILFLLLIQIIYISLFGAQKNDDYFSFDKSLRIDFILTGTADTQNAGIVNLIEEPFWSGNKKSLIWPMDYGSYIFEVYTADGTLIFKNGFSTLFEEWQTTALVDMGPSSYEQSINIPMPKRAIEIQLKVRKRSGLELVSRWDIDPRKDIFVKKNPIYKSQKVYGKSDPKESLDIVFLADGYLAEDSLKALKDTKRFANYLYSQPPFKYFKNHINIWLVHVPSIESGTSEPRKGVFKQTVLNSSFNSLGLERYLTTSSYFKLKDLAAAAPYDVPVVMVNTDRYGGGGIFNHFSVFSADSQWAMEVFLHEFGHQFGGLADEYFDSEVSYEEMLDTTKEPWNPNITTLVEFNGKWEPLISKGTPVPTPRNNKFKGETGVFEGGAYMSKGVYSPAMDCKMKTNTAKEFCSACQNAIKQMLKLYIK
jgi:hypothetical protein